MAHHVLRRLLKKKRFILGPPLDGASVDPSLLLLYLMSDAGASYFSRVHGIDVSAWPDDLRVLADADPFYFGRIEGIDVNPWPETIRVLSDGYLIYERLDGIITDPWQDNIIVLADADPVFFGKVDGIDTRPWPETLRIMSEVAVLPWALINGLTPNRFGDTLRVMSRFPQGGFWYFYRRGVELGDPSPIRLITAPFFRGLRLGSGQGIILKDTINDMRVLSLAEALRAGIFRGPELGDPNSKRLITAPFFNGFVWPYQDGVDILKYINDFFMMSEADAIRAGVFRGPELGDPSVKRIISAPFLAAEIWPYQDGLSVLRTGNNLGILSLADAFIGGVVRGGEIGDPSPLRIDVDLDLTFAILSQRLDADIVPNRVGDSVEVSGNFEESTVSLASVYATSDSATVLFGSQPESEEYTLAANNVFATSEPSNLLFSSQPETDNFTQMNDLDFFGLSPDPSLNRISTTSEFSDQIANSGANTGLNPYRLETGADFTVE